MHNSDKLINVYAKDRAFSVVPHILVWDYGRGRDRDLYFASYVGIPEAVQAVTASILEGRDIRYRQFDYSRLVADPYKRVAKVIGMGDVAHGCVYNSYFEFGEVESQANPENFNRALVFAADGDIHKSVVEHAMARFGLPREWEHQYAALLEDYWNSLSVTANPDFPQWQNAKAALFSAREEEVIDVVSNALRKGRLVIPPSAIQGRFDPTWSMNAYMVNNAENLAKQLEEKQPRHVFSARLDPAIGDLKRIPFPVQAHMVQALVNTIEDEKPACGGDMGSGKSIIACGVAHVYHERKKRRGSKRGTAVLLSAPGITLSKWETKEIRGTIPNVSVHTIRSGNDALQLLRKVRNGYRPQGLEFTLVGIDRAKLGSELYFSGVWRRLHGKDHQGEGLPPYAWHCPDCGKLIMIPIENKASSKEDLVPADWSVFAEGAPPSKEEIDEARFVKGLLPNGLPRGFSVKWKREASMPRFCINTLKAGHEVGDDSIDGRPCGGRFWRPALKSRGETKNRPRANISQVLKRTKRFFDLYVCDEAHQCKAENSGRGDAFAQMVKAAKKTIMLTGTLTNGKSSSIKELLWRTDPRSLLDSGFDHRTGSLDWAKRFGKVEEIVRLEEGDEGVVTRRKNRESTVREAPGIAPHMTAQFLLHKSGFIELSDMQLPLTR